MARMSHPEAKVFQVIPGVGKAMSEDFLELGYTSLNDLAGEDPQEMYERITTLRGCHVDRCVLYVYRLAVYFAEGGREEERLKWWNWKD